MLKLMGKKIFVILRLKKIAYLNLWSLIKTYVKTDGLENIYNFTLKIFFLSKPLIL